MPGETEKSMAHRELITPGINKARSRTAPFMVPVRASQIRSLDWRLLRLPKPTTTTPKAEKVIVNIRTPTRDAKTKPRTAKLNAARPQELPHPGNELPQPH